MARFTTVVHVGGKTPPEIVVDSPGSFHLPTPGFQQFPQPQRAPLLPAETRVGLLNGLSYGQ